MRKCGKRWPATPFVLAYAISCGELSHGAALFGCSQRDHPGVRPSQNHCGGNSRRRAEGCRYFPGSWWITSPQHRAVGPEMGRLAVPMIIDTQQLGTVRTRVWQDRLDRPPPPLFRNSEATPPVRPAAILFSNSLWILGSACAHVWALYGLAGTHRDACQRLPGTVATLGLPWQTPAHGVVPTVLGVSLTLPRGPRRACRCHPM